MQENQIKQNYLITKEQLAGLGIDAQRALDILSKVSISLHCWQGDDVRGFESADSALSGGGIAVTGNHLGRARNIYELQSDIEKALSFIPGKHRLNLHAIYGDFSSGLKDRDEIEIDNFKCWVEWAKVNGLKLDFNATCFSHPNADDGYTLSHRDNEIRSFWIEHIKRCRKIASYFGKEQGSASIHNLWIPDGSKDNLLDRISPRERLKDSLDQIYADKYSSNELKDAVESKLFGIGSESYVVGSHEFYMGYALKNNLMLCLDAGHFHPTETISDKISSLLLFSDELLIHVSRGVRWDSDHVVILNDELREICNQIVSTNSLDKIHIALDYFDGSINRIGAWVIGARAVLKAVLLALVIPSDIIRNNEVLGNNFARLAYMEETKSFNLSSIWDYYCLINNVPPAHYWIDEVNKYEDNITSKRDIK